MKHAAMALALLAALTGCRANEDQAQEETPTQAHECRNAAQRAAEM